MFEVPLFLSFFYSLHMVFFPVYIVFAKANCETLSRRSKKCKTRFTTLVCKLAVWKWDSWRERNFELHWSRISQKWKRVKERWGKTAHSIRLTKTNIKHADWKKPGCVGPTRCFWNVKSGKDVVSCATMHLKGFVWTKQKPNRWCPMKPKIRTQGTAEHK